MITVAIVRKNGLQVVGEVQSDPMNSFVGLGYKGNNIILILKN